MGNTIGSTRPDLLFCLTKNEIAYENYKRNTEIDPTNLQVSKKQLLGEGNFGIVELGVLRKGTESLKVAVKRSKQPDDYRERELFLAELTVMCALEKHPNLLCLIGGVTTSKPNQIVLEYIEGRDLKEYLRDSRKRFKDMKTWIEADNEQRKSGNFANQHICLNSDLNELSTFDLISFAYQIANGMKYLASVPCVHRDLALRNVLIDSDGTIRITDFGLSRKYLDTDYYRPESGNTDKPWLWMAPEAFQRNEFTEKTDIFSYGICLYELFSLGEDPIIDNIWRPFWQKSEYLPLPEFSTARIYNHMKMCWNMDPNARPNFSLCLEHAEGELKNCSKKIFNDVKGKLKNVCQKHSKLEGWVTNDQPYVKESRMWKELIPLQRLGNFLTPDDPECVAKCEIKNVYRYNWTLEVFSEKMCLPNCYVFELSANSIFGLSCGLEDREDDIKAECSLVLYHDDRAESDTFQAYFNGGTLVLGNVPISAVNLHTVNLKLEVKISEIFGCNCSRSAKTPDQNRVTLNIGGVEFQTTKETLTKYNGIFNVYLEIELFIKLCRDTNIFEDRSPKNFGSILNFMRNGVLKLESDKEVRELLREAKYYRMPDLIKLCLEHLGSRISLNIGGTTFQTTKETLTRFDGKFKTMLENDTLNKSNNTIFIDRSPKHFDLILNYMRDGEVDLPDGRRELKEILKEAEYYNLIELIVKCQVFLNE